tara:strand:+ start:215 stop:1012 length:798 start_codon:yes stop_codon:yes gene_type:complete
MDSITLYSLILIILVGLPHGALDGAVSLCLEINNSLRNIIIFISVYILIAFIVVILWLNFSELALIFFLIISIMHFGIGDLEWESGFSKYILGFFIGGLVVVGTSLLNRDDVNNIFLYLSERTDMVWYFIEYSSYLWILSVPYFINKIDKFSTQFLIKIFFIFIFVVFLPPLLAFSFYFCFIHTINHFGRIVPQLKNKMTNKKIFYTFLLFTLSSWLIGFIVYELFKDSFDFVELTYKILFIGLAALTVPHMILIDFYFRPLKKV